jgi:hypothetical protein
MRGGRFRADGARAAIGLAQPPRRHGQNAPAGDGQGKLLPVSRRFSRRAAKRVAS